MVIEALRQTLLELVDTLAARRLQYAIMGGIAVAAWEYLRVTRDVDVLVAIDQSRIAGAVEHFRAAGFHTRRNPPVFDVGGHKFIQLFREPRDLFLEIRVDLMLATSEFQQVALQRRTMLELPGLASKVAVVTCEDLIILKLLAGRIIDRSDVAALLKANRNHFDLEHLVHWATRLALHEELAGIWNEEFPGQTLPGRHPS